MEIGNGFVDHAGNLIGQIEFSWSHAQISDETHAAIRKECNFSSRTVSEQCHTALENFDYEIGDIDFYNIYSPLCHHDSNSSSNTGVAKASFDPCSDDYVVTYLNNPAVQKALHSSVPHQWQHCSSKLKWTDKAITMLPTIKKLIASNIAVWLYSGDMDGVCPITATRYFINLLRLPVKNSWRPWYLHNEVLSNSQLFIAMADTESITMRFETTKEMVEQLEKKLNELNSNRESCLSWEEIKKYFENLETSVERKLMEVKEMERVLEEEERSATCKMIGVREEAVVAKEEALLDRLQLLRRTCFVLMEAAAPVMGMTDPGDGRPVSSEIKQQAKEIADQWMAKLAGVDVDASNGYSLEVLAFLQFPATFGIAEEFDVDALYKLVIALSRHREAPEVCRSIGLTEKMPGFVETLVNSGRPIDAVHFAHAFQLTESFPPVPPLKEHLEKTIGRKAAASWSEGSSPN